MILIIITIENNYCMRSYILICGNYHKIAEILNCIGFTDRKVFLVWNLSNFNSILVTVGRRQQIQNVVAVQNVTRLQIYSNGIPSRNSVVMLNIIDII